MEKEDQIPNILRYVPQIVVARFLRNPEAIKKAETCEFEAACGFFDISGFSTLGSRLQEVEKEIKVIERRPGALAEDDMSPKLKQDLNNLKKVDRQTLEAKNLHTITSRMANGFATEQLTTMLNNTLSPVINVIMKYRGDIIKFVGDAMIVVWETSYSLKVTTSSGLLSYYACQCALEAIQILHDQEFNTNLNEKQEKTGLGMHVGIGVSPMTGNHVGGMLNRWEFYLHGDGCRQMNFAEADAHEGEVVISRETYSSFMQCKEDLKDLSLDAIELDSGNYKLNSIYSPFIIPIQRNFTPKYSSEILTELLCYVPGCVKSSIMSGDGEIQGINRTVTVVFIKLNNSVSVTKPETQLQFLQESLLAIQEATYYVYASLRQFVIDDKGAVAIAIIGLPPLFHENNSSRGVKLALRLIEKGIKCSIGITTGNCFCGTIGNATRSEYAVVGDVTNLASRLMGLAKPKQILCDLETKTNADSFFDIDSGKDMKVKGKKEKVRVFTVFPGHGRKVDPATKGETLLTEEQNRIIGQQDALRALSGLSTWTKTNNRVIVLRGDYGTGKSMLVKNVDTVTNAVLVGNPDSLESDSKFYAWKNILRTLLEVSKKAISIEQQNNSNDASHQSKTNIVSTRNTSTKNSNSNNTSGRGSRISWSHILKKEAAVEPEKHVIPEEKCVNEWNLPEEKTVATSTIEIKRRIPNLVRALRAKISVLSLAASHASHSVEVPDVRSSALITTLMLSGKITSETLPLLNTILSINTPETPITLNYSQEKREKILMRMIVDMLEELSRTKPVVLVFDNAHWIDLASWTLLELVIGCKSRVHVLLTMRIDRTQVGSCCHSILKCSQTEIFELKNLNRNDTSLLLSTRFAIRIMDPKFLDFVYNQTQGNPGEVIKVTEQLVKSNKIAIDKENGTIMILEKLTRSDIPVSSDIYATILPIVDSLVAPAQTVLKCASVYGKVIHADILKSLITHMLDTIVAPTLYQDGTELRRDSVNINTYYEEGLNICQVQNLLLYDEKKSVYTFESDHVRAIVYDTMLVSHRHALHAHIITWYEEQYKNELEKQIDKSMNVGYHCICCGQLEKASYYYECGAIEALIRGSYYEAFYCVRQMSDIVDELEQTKHNYSKSVKLINNIKLHYLLAQLEILSENWQKVLDHLKLVSQDAKSLGVKSFFGIYQIKPHDDVTSAMATEATLCYYASKNISKDIEAMVKSHDKYKQNIRRSTKLVMSQKFISQNWRPRPQLVLKSYATTKDLSSLSKHE